MPTKTKIQCTAQINNNENNVTKRKVIITELPTKKREILANFFFQEDTCHVSMPYEEERGLRMCGHVTGRVWRWQLQTSKGAAKHDVFSWSLDFAKLNLKCHMNYS